MSRASRLSLLSLCGAVVMLAGCGRSPAPAAATSTAAVPKASKPAVAHAATTAPGEHVVSKRYRIDISYPRLPPADAVLTKALHQAAAKARQDFMAGLPDPRQYPGLANRQFQLKLDFSVAARMPAFVSVREKGMADTGGAHPIPLDASFVYATDAGRLITLDDLFVDPAQARQRLSAAARKTLEARLLAKVPGGARTPAKARAQWTANMRQMIAQGTQPTTQNFAQFVVLAGAGNQAAGLLLIFPPYQVAPYTYGSQTVQVSVDAFSDLLKPAWRGDFDTGK